MEHADDIPTVLISGSGPVGLTLALALHAHGVPVRIVGKAPGVSEHSKALVIWARTLEDLAAVTDVEEFIDAGIVLQGARFHEGAESIAELEMPEDRSRFPAAVMIPQYRTEQLLLERLEAAGITVEWETELVACTPGPERVECRLRRADGSEEACTADWLLAADGAHSTVRSQLGLDFQGDDLPTTFLIADVVLDPPFEPGYLDIFLQPRQGLCACFPVDRTTTRLVVSLLDEAGVGDEPSLEFVQGVIDRTIPGGVVASDPTWLATFRVHERVLERFRVGRVLLAGDAAHTHSPAGGHGMNTGMQDACNLAWKLAMHLRGIGGEPLLESYHSERSHAARKVVEDSSRFTRVATISHPALSFLRKTGLRVATRFEGIRHHMLDNLMMMDIDYRDVGLPRVGAVPRNHGALAPGCHLPLLHVTDVDRGVTPLDAVLDPRRFTLLVVENPRTPSFPKAIDSMLATVAELAPGLAELVEVVAVRSGDDAGGGSVRSVQDHAGEVSEAMGFRGHGVVLVRPDRVASLFSGALDGTEVRRWFDSL